jgi:RimJ/RimL family protein N-acetyltransferase
VKLQGNTIYLRPLQLGDADGNYPNWLNDPDVCRYNSHGEILYTREMAKIYITDTVNNPSVSVFAICKIQNNQHIGNIALQQISAKNRSAEFAILIGEPSVHGSGIGFEASSLLFDYGFNTLKLHRIYCGTHSENIGMQKLALKLGMAQEGLRRDAIFKNSSFADIVEYGILYDDTTKGQQ